MKLSPIQVAASAVGAVLAAVIASFFGVKGTVIGVAIGSVVATTGTSIVAESLRRTHKAVRVVVKNAEQFPFLHRGSATSAAGTVTDASADGSVDAVVATPVGQGQDPASGRAVEVEGMQTEEVPAADAAVSAAVSEATAATAVSAGTPDEVSDVRLLTSSRSGRPAAGTGTSVARPAPGSQPRRRPSWRTLVVSIAVVFAVGFAAVTVFELIAGRPLSSLVGSGGPSSGTSAGHVFGATTSPTTTTTTTTTTTSTTVPSSTTTTTPSTTTTTTTPSASTTTTTAPGGTPPPVGG